MADMVRYVQETTPQVRFTALNVVRHTFRLSSLDEFIATCRHLPCDGIQVSQCRFTLSFGTMLGECVIDIPRARLAVNADLTSTMWEALEAGLLRPSEEELRTLLTSLDRTADPYNNEEPQFRWKYRTLVCKVLCATQTADPRSSVHYRGKKWCVDGLQGLQMGKLSRIALHFLIQLAKNIDQLCAFYPYLYEE
ncbi:uncharacterized protein LOC129599964 isoform X2 [Paramacrobiotus metropolitanus]|uniref:uncharacterized protein LOC129599964 isoform X2 n=1 Tax=Paramacrobiotus metropolitanus TaxID=2943436 RepID=UPI002445A7E2|nr:uncharacterized protein LOC129599964 isoform X2 [Paramacrobiotus metropolitanus]